MLGARAALSLALSTLVGAGVLACGPGKPNVEVDGWALARAALVDGESCYAERSEYCISDPAFIDAAIQSALEGRWKGQMPKLSRDVEQVIRSARIDYQNASKTPESMAKIEGLVAAYYADPKLDLSDPKLVNVDLGALPGRLSTQGRVSEMVLRDSDLIEEFRWSGAEAGRVLGKFALAHPDAELIRVQLIIPKGMGTDPMVYRYFREQNRVAFGELLEDSIYLSPPIPGGPEAMAAGKLVLGRGDVKLCSRPKTGDDGPNEWCPWADAYGEEAKRAEREAAREKRNQ